MAPFLMNPIDDQLRVEYFRSLGNEGKHGQLSQYQYPSGFYSN